MEITFGGQNKTESKTKQKHTPKPQPIKTEEKKRPLTLLSHDSKYIVRKHL